MSNGNSNTGMFSCDTVCWIVAVIFGIAVAAILHNWADWGWLLSFVVGIIGALGAGWLLTSQFCDEVAAETGSATPAISAGGAAAAASEPSEGTADDAAGDADDAEGSTGKDDAGEPQTFTTAPEGGGDNLKEIKGVGPALEKTLNEMGIYTFAQIAKWGASDIEWVDERLTFKGRIMRDDWVGQAKSLGEGGET